MLHDDDEEITVEEVNRVLSEIENKYSLVQCYPTNSVFPESLVVLSKEFDSVGVQSIDLIKPPDKVFEQVVSSARALVQIHRITLSQMKDLNINIQSSNTKSNYLHKVVDNCHSKINSYEDKAGILENKIAVLNEKIVDYKKREAEMKNELDKIKRNSNAKNNEYSRLIKKLSDENKRFKDSLMGINKLSKDEMFVKFIGNYKQNEEIYKDTIHKLQENNRELLEELMDLRCQKNH